jgi:hypothetical protein
MGIFLTNSKPFCICFVFWWGLTRALLKVLRIFTCLNPVRASSWLLVYLVYCEPVVACLSRGQVCFRHSIFNNFLLWCLVFCLFQSGSLLWGMRRKCASLTQTLLNKLKSCWRTITLLYAVLCLGGVLHVVTWEVSSKALFVWGLFFCVTLKMNADRDVVHVYTVLRVALPFLSCIEPEDRDSSVFRNVGDFSSRHCGIFHKTWFRHCRS